jgi:DNA-binding CsgD family transcriptional regulator
MAGYHQNRDGSLSPREREVLELMAKGLTNGQIAERLDIAFDTAKSHVSAIISKLGVETREEAVRLWREERRVGRRFSRAIRGMVVALGIGKIAAGTAGVAVIGAGVATGAALYAGGDSPDAPRLALQAAAGTPSPTPSLAIPISFEDFRTPGNWETATVPNGPLHTLGTVEVNGQTYALAIYESVSGWCFQFGPPMEPFCNTIIQDGTPRLQAGSAGQRIGGAGVIHGSLSRDAVRVELLLADGSVVQALPLMPPPEFPFAINYWMAGLERTSDLLEVRALAADGTVLKTTGAFPADQPHVVGYNAVDFRAGRSAGDPLSQRLPTPDSTGYHFSVAGAPPQITFTVEHDGPGTIDVRYVCDEGTPGLPAEVSYDEPRGPGGSGRFVLDVPEGATLCQWFIGNWEGDFRIVSAQ